MTSKQEDVQKSGASRDAVVDVESKQI